MKNKTKITKAYFPGYPSLESLNQDIETYIKAIKDKHHKECLYINIETEVEDMSRSKENHFCYHANVECSLSPMPVKMVPDNLRKFVDYSQDL